jgi:hypothetical protein
MEKEFVPYELALKMKQLHFDEGCFGRFSNEGDLLIAHTEKYIISNGVDRSKFFTQAPTFSQAFRWFRKEYGLKFHIREDMWNNWCTISMIEDGDYVNCGEYETYDATELECLKKLIEIVESKSE